MESDDVRILGRDAVLYFGERDGGVITGSRRPSRERREQESKTDTSKTGHSFHFCALPCPDVESICQSHQAQVSSCEGNDIVQNAYRHNSSAPEAVSR